MLVLGPAVISAAAWIASQCAHPSGALLVRPNGQYVSGYFGSIVSSALVRSKQRPDIALAWMRWYVAHSHDSGSGIDGVVDDIDIVDGAERSRGRPDSTDAYGAMFLMLARDAFDSGNAGLVEFVRNHRPDLVRIMDSSVATQQENGLTFARPQHEIYYAIDNVQVYRGLIDAADLFRRAYSDETTAKRYEALAQRVKNGIDGVLWDPASKSFRPYMNKAGTSGPANLSVPYPDALAQVLAIYYGALDPQSAQAAELMSRVTATMLASSTPHEEQRLALLATQAKLHTPVRVPDFAEPRLCVDAAWYIFAAMDANQ